MHIDYIDGNSDFLNLIDDLKYNNGDRINSLIKRGVITANEVAEQVIETGNVEYILLASRFISDIPIKKLAKALVDIEDRYIYKGIDYNKNDFLKR